MKIIRVFAGFALFVFLFINSRFCFGFEWIRLHDKATSMHSADAIKDFVYKADTPEDLYVLGLVYLEQYKALEAQMVFKEILKEEPDNMAARWGVAETLRRQHNYADSIPMLEKIMYQSPDFAPAYITLAYIRYIQGDFDGSIKLTGKVINMGRKNVDAANFLRSHGLYAAAKGMIAHYGGPLSKAINGAGVLKHLHIIQKLAPDSPVVNFGLGSYYMLIPRIFGQDLDKARDYLKKTIEEDPLFPDPYVRLAQIYRHEGLEQKYNELIDKALDLDPKNELALDIKNRTCRFICLEDIN